MEANQILQSDFLDILFEGKNKDYGAYDLRKTYLRRVAAALILMLMSILFLVIAYDIAANLQKDEKFTRALSPDIILKNIPPEKAESLPLPKLPSPVHVATIKFPPPLVVKDASVTEIPPDIKQLEGAKIDLKTIDGPSTIGIVNPPSEIEGSNVIIAPETKKTEDQVPFRTVDIEASFPGGADAWQRYIKRAIMKRLDEFSDADYGTCIIEFVVDKNGNVSDVTAKTMNGTMLAKIAINTITNGPNWTPAMENGRYVNAYRTQPVTLNNPNQ